MPEPGPALNLNPNRSHAGCRSAAVHLLPPAIPSAHLNERISDLLDSVRALYEQEKYEQALQTLNQVFLLDPEHNRGAEELRQQIEEAWQLAEVIKQEAARHRAAEPLPAPAPKPVIPHGRKDSDFWGPTEVRRDHADPIAASRMLLLRSTPKKPKEPALDRIAHAGVEGQDPGEADPHRRRRSPSLPLWPS